MSTSAAVLVHVGGTALRDGEPRERYRQKLARITLDAMMQFVGLLDADGRVIEINQSALDAAGLTLSDVEHQPFWKTFWWQTSAEANTTLQNMVARAAAGETVRWDAEIIGRGNEIVIVDASLSPVKDDAGNVVFIIAEGRDITEKKAREQQVAHQREELAKLGEFKATLFDKAPLGIYVVDADLVIRQVNPAARPVFREVPGSVIGRRLDEVLHFLRDEAYAEEVVGIFRHVLETGESYIRPEPSEHRNERGTCDYFEWRLERIAMPDCRFGVVCYFRDITEQVQAEQTRQLLLRELSHRVKNTLASVQAIAQQTLRRTKEPADFAARLSGRIQSLARAHSLLTGAAWRGADLQDLVHDQLQMGPVDRTRLTVWGPSVQLEPQLTVHLSLMMHELATNSVKYGALSMPDGHVAISWSVRDDVLHLRWMERGGPVISVPFTRGFGTILIEQSARSAGGSAEMLFEEHGITWVIALPLPQAAAPRRAVRQVAAGVASVRPAAPLSGLHLLVVEDEPLISLDLVGRLEAAGAEQVMNTGTENDAIRLVEEHPFDAALIDANLHGHPVDAIATALARRDVPFVFVTGYGHDGLPAAFAHVPILAKPCSDEQLFETLSAIAGAKRPVVARTS